MALVVARRNAICRLLVESIPLRSLMFGILPEKFLSPLCQLRSASVPYLAKHMFFYCHLKVIVWKQITFEFLWPSVEISDITLALFSLDFYNIHYCQKSGISAQMVILITLVNIWSRRWTFINTNLSVRNENEEASSITKIYLLITY
jgi:hypothetical protein